LYLEYLIESPWAHLLPTSVKPLVRKVTLAKRHRILSPEIAAREAYHDILQQEMAFSRSDEIVSLAQRYQKVALTHPKTHIATRALHDQLRVYKNFKTLSGGNAKTLTFLPPNADEKSVTAFFLKLSRLLNRQS
tara:strand:- start:209 stop:610 length:402 start_codon:yes stop_codon:yes gene_type:complete